MTETNFYIQER